MGKKLKPIIVLDHTISDKLVCCVSESGQPAARQTDGEDPSHLFLSTG